MRHLRYAVAAAVLAVAVGVPIDAHADVEWVPPLGARWQYQLQGDVDANVCTKPPGSRTCVRPEVYDFDLYRPDGVTLNTLGVDRVHAADARAVCYVSAGSYENWRPDKNTFPAAVLGKSNGWPGEKWLDIRAQSTLLPIIDARVARCVDAGFDAIEFDNVDGYSNNTGFPLTAAHQLSYNRALADLAHARGLAVGLKNDVEQAATLRSSFDFAINEQCGQYQECGVYDAWTAHGQAVLEIEYGTALKRFCPAAIAGGRSAIKKTMSLKAKPWTPCA